MKYFSTNIYPLLLGVACTFQIFSMSLVMLTNYPVDLKPALCSCICFLSILPIPAIFLSIVNVSNLVKKEYDRVIISALYYLI